MRNKVINRSGHPLREYSSEGSASLDLRANPENNILLIPIEGVLVPGGMYIEMRVNF